jgi:hypothetical protein
VFGFAWVQFFSSIGLTFAGTCLVANVLAACYALTYFLLLPPPDYVPDGCNQLHPLTSNIDVGDEDEEDDMRVFVKNSIKLTCGERLSFTLSLYRYMVPLVIV